MGAAVLLRRLAERSEVEFEDQPPHEEEEPLVVSYSSKKSKNSDVVARTEQLQQWLNTFPGVFVKVDGVPGERTSNAYKTITGAYLPGDPRNA
jgi:hypothetical protein